MSSLGRLVPFVWPHRRLLLLSLLFAGLSALFWSGTLAQAYPVVQTLMDGQSIQEYLDETIVTLEKEIEGKTKSVGEIDEKLKQLPEAHPDAIALVSRKARDQDKMGDFARELLMLNWVKAHIIPILPEDQFDLLAVILGVLVGMTILKGICIFLQEVLVGSVVELTVMGVRKECFRRALKLDYQTLSLEGTSKLMSRFTFDVNTMATGLTLLGGKVIREPLKAGTCIACAFMVNWRLTLISLIFVPITGVVFYRFGRILKHASHRVMDSMSRIYKVLEETFDALKVVIAFDQAAVHRRQFHRENKEYYAKAMKIVNIDSLATPTTEVLCMLAVMLTLLPSAYLVLRETTTIWGIRLSTHVMDIAELVLLYAFLGGVIDSVRKLSTVYPKLKRSSAAAERIFAMMDRESLVKQPTNPKRLPRHRESIQFQAVEFVYAQAADAVVHRPAALNHVDLKIAAGEVVALVGENGSGKSTLVNMLPRFFDPTLGAVLVDGIDTREASLRELRAQIGVVTQETLLFSGSIYDNIRYGRPGATRAEIQEAATQAHVTQFAEQLPNGFDTQVGDKGRQLSGGQRQRIALARAILRDPAILILDEATSAIDAQSEYLIHEALCEFVKGRTTFLVTHSVSQSILNLVTRIVVMDQGRVVASGPHETLIQSCPLYQSLFQAQVRQRSA